MNISEKGKLFWLGFFIIGAVFIVGWLILFLRPSLGDGKTTLRVLFTNIEKISEGTRVTFAGKPVGEVDTICQIENARSCPPNKEGNLYFFELLLKVDSSVRIYNFDEIIVSTSGLMGEKMVAIIPKPAPEGSPPAYDITCELLYAKSVDRINAVLDTVESSLTSVQRFLDSNSEVLSQSITSVKVAAEDISYAMDDLSGVVKRLSSPQGTLGRLIHSDNLYLQLNATLTRFDQVLQDINRYGILFQFSGKWQKERNRRLCKMSCLNDPCSFYNYFQEKLFSISTSLEQISSLLNRMDSSPCSSSAREVLDQTERLGNDLNLYNQMLLDQYLQSCY